MQYYWDAFIDKYRDVIHFRSLQSILQAFYYFSQNKIEECDSIMRPERVPSKDGGV
jgi:hypothetical protein